MKKTFYCALFLSQALEYLLWASICMESSVPLLSIRYLTWRATLYTAVCQCYYDCQAGIHGEVRYFLTLRMPIFKNTTYSAFFSLDEQQENKQANKTQRIAVKQRQMSQALFAEICLTSPFCWSLTSLSVSPFILYSLLPSLLLF